MPTDPRDEPTAPGERATRAENRLQEPEAACSGVTSNPAPSALVGLVSRRSDVEAEGMTGPTPRRLHPIVAGQRRYGTVTAGHRGALLGTVNRTKAGPHCSRPVNPDDGGGDTRAPTRRVRVRRTNACRCYWPMMLTTHVLTVRHRFDVPGVAAPLAPAQVVAHPPRRNLDPVGQHPRASVRRHMTALPRCPAVVGQVGMRSAVPWPARLHSSGVLHVPPEAGTLQDVVVVHVAGRTEARRVRRLRHVDRHEHRRRPDDPARRLGAPLALR